MRVTSWSWWPRRASSAAPSTCRRTATWRATTSISRSMRCCARPRDGPALFDLLGNTRDAERLPVPVLDGHGGKTADGCACLDVAHDAALGGDLRAAADGEVIGNAGLAAHHDAIAHHGAAGDADL